MGGGVRIRGLLGENLVGEGARQSGCHGQKRSYPVTSPPGTAIVYAYVRCAHSLLTEGKMKTKAKPGSKNSGKKSGKKC
jgi:hypothetical protein